MSPQIKDQREPFPASFKVTLKQQTIQSSTPRNLWQEGMNIFNPILTSVFHVFKRSILQHHLRLNRYLQQCSILDEEREAQNYLKSLLPLAKMTCFCNQRSFTSLLWRIIYRNLATATKRSYTPWQRPCSLPLMFNISI